MKKEKVYIVASHSRLPTKDRTRPGALDVTERVEFVNQLRNKHIQMSTAAVDYIEEKVVIGASKGIEYHKFIQYVTERYPKQMAELKKAYKPEPDIEVELVDGIVKVKAETE